jgi:hypothetical protein
MGAGDAAGAHATFSTSLKTQLTEEKLKRLLEESPGAFKIKSSTLQGNVEVENGVPVSTVKGSVVNEKGETRYWKFRAIEDPPASNAWKIIAFDVSSKPH